MFLAKVAAQNLFRKGSDVDNANVYGFLDRKIVIEQPTDSTQRQRQPGKVCLLEKSTYGARQAGVVWGCDMLKKRTYWNSEKNTQD